MATKKRKKYLVTKESEAYACSLVTSPAVEELFVSFSEDKPIIEKFADEKKHMITGVVAIPNKPIYRRNEKTGEEFDIVFSAEAIEEMAKDFMRNYRQQEVTLQHQEDAEGIYLVEQWIKTSMTMDKSIQVGLSADLPVGSWIQTYYVDSNDVWQRIESGELRGFSLECLLGLEEFESQITNNENNNSTMTNEEMFGKLKEMFNQLIESVGIKPIAMAEEALEANEPTPSVEPNVEPTPSVEPQNEPSVEPTVEPNVEPTPNVKPTVEEPKEPVVEEPKVDTPVEQPTDNHLEELIKSLKEEVETLKEMNNGLNKKVKELSKTPSAAPINVNAKPSGVGGDTYSQWRSQMAQMLGY